MFPISCHILGHFQHHSYVSLWERLSMDAYVYSVVLMAPSYCLWRWQPPLSKTMSTQDTVFIKTMSAQDIIFIKTMSAQDAIFICRLEHPTPRILHSYYCYSFVTEISALWSSPVLWCWPVSMQLKTTYTTHRAYVPSRKNHHVAKRTHVSLVTLVTPDILITLVTHVTLVTLPLCSLLLYLKEKSGFVASLNEQVVKLFFNNCQFFQVSFLV